MARVQTNFTAGTAGGGSSKRGGQRRRKPVEDAPVREERSEDESGQPEPVAPVEATRPAEPEEVPTGSIAEVKRWVGEDKGRAQQALDAEQAKDEPRSTLVKHLNEVKGE